MPDQASENYCGSNGQCASDLHICGLFTRENMEACVVSRSHEYVSVENRTWDKRKTYFDKSMDIAVCRRISTGRYTECISAIRSGKCSVFNTCICRISSLSWNLGFAGLFS